MARWSTGWTMSAMKSMGRDNQTTLHWVLMSLYIFTTCKAATSQSMPQPLVRIAEIEIDPTQFEAYTRALREEISTSVRTEPGVLTLYAVAIKDHPSQIRIFETYADKVAYEKHVQSLHFKKYKSETQGMVRSLNLIETSPILLGAKTGQH